MESNKNILFVVIDSLRYDAVSGSDHPETPVIDTLVSNGIDHGRAYAGGPYTRASMPAMLSGTYPWMFGGYERLRAGRPYVAEALSDAGYLTAGFHSNPYLGAEFGYDRGFDHFFDGRSETSVLSNLRRHVARLLPRETRIYRLLRWIYKRWEGTLGREFGTPYVDGESLNEQVFGWLDRIESDNPAFCWVQYMDVHHPYIPHENTVSEGIEKKRAIRLRQRMIESPENLSEVDVETLRTLYDGEVEYADACLGRLLDRVDATWGLDDTTVVVTSDHGEAFGEHGRYGHTDTLYDEVTRVPFVVTDPNRSSRTADYPVSGVDVTPTILDVAEVLVPDECVGESAFETDRNADRTVFTQVGEPGDGGLMAFDGTWKAIVDLQTDSIELYDIVDDPEECDNRAASRADVVDAFEDKIDDHLRFVDRRVGAEANADIPADVAERLERLGYKE